MCGIAGFLGHDERLFDEVLPRMPVVLRHRGPDDRGTWSDREAGVGLAHSRLSILDLSQEGHQPMLSAGGRLVLVYNGEVYNHAELRHELEASGKAPTWRGHSDTEVMLAAMEAWGVAEATARFAGIFAFAVWDRQEHTLHLARDPIGVKPLYYSQVEDGLVFGSELAALRTDPRLDREVARGALALLLRHGHIPAPHSILRGTSKLPAGTLLSVSRAGQHGTLSLSSRAYWSVPQAVVRAAARPFAGTYEDAAAELDRRLRDSVRQQMVADVPLGVFLSGGIDSSLVAALMQAQSERPVQSFTIGFEESAFDEAPCARAVAQHLGTRHTELYVSAAEGLRLVPELPRIFDEPFADPSQLPTRLLAQLTRRHVTVSLSGDGGDELFAGYSHYFAARDLWRLGGWLPAAFRGAAAGLWNRLTRGQPERPLLALAQLLPDGRRGSFGRRASKLLELAAAPTYQEVHRIVRSHWAEPCRVVLGAAELPTVLSDPRQWAPVATPLEHMMAADLAGYLCEDVLTKVDRASMSVALEARVPLLDHRLVEFVLSLPLSMKVEGRQGKRLLRHVLHSYVPPGLVDRPKQGFAIPLASWLRRDLSPWAEELLDESRLRREGYFDPEPIRRKWREHRSGRAEWHYHLWAVLMFQAWLERWATPLPPTPSYDQPERGPS